MWLGGRLAVELVESQAPGLYRSMPGRAPTIEVLVLQATIPFHEAGTVSGKIDVEVTYQIIGLFSEGLYSSPYKAFEELVSNAFDADATTVHLVVPADLAESSAAIVVVDDGTRAGARRGSNCATACGGATPVR
jgi:hypothetical protein